MAKKIPDQNVKKPEGRPSKYHPHFAVQALKLCLLGYSDEQIAWFFDVDMNVLAEWACDNKDFYDAITPSQQVIDEFNVACQKRRDKKNQTKRDRLQSDNLYRLENSMRSRLWAALKGKSEGSLFSRLGYSLTDLKIHLEKQFSNGMTWDNYGKWHVDHIRPCASFDLSQPLDFDLCWSLDNLQPLWAADNIKKGDSYACS